MAGTRLLKRIAFSVISSLLGIVAALLLTEVALRLFWTPVTDHTVNQELQPSEIFGHELIPGESGMHSSTEYDYPFRNSPQGFRADAVYSAALPAPFKRRVLLLGDSFTYGMGVPIEKTFASRLAAKLPETEVINGGVSAYGQRNMLALLDTKGAALSPDIVMVFLFWNDLDDNVTSDKPDYRLDAAGKIVRTDYTVPASYDPLALRYERRAPDRRSWGRKTYVYQFYKDALAAVRHRLFGRTDWYLTNDTPEKLAAAWELTYDYLRMLKLRSEQLGATFYLFHLPDYALVDANQQYKELPRHIVDIRPGFATVCARLGARCLDLTPALREAAANSSVPLYYADDRHLTAAGHQAVADAVSELLDTAGNRPRTGQQPSVP